MPQYVIDVPYEPDEAAVAYVAEQLRGMQAFLEEQTGRKIDQDALREAGGPEPSGAWTTTTATSPCGRTG